MNAANKSLLSARHFFCSLFFARPLKLGGRSIISFTFDDVPASTYETGVPILKKYGIHATFYVAAAFCDIPGYLGIPQIKNLLNSGHEIACHTFSHIKTGFASPRRLKKDLDRNRNFFKNYFDYTLDNFSYPYGSVGIWNKPLLQSRYHSMRTTCEGTNRGAVDLNMLKAFRLYSGRMTEERLKTLIGQTASDGSWTIFYTHDVASHPSPFGCTPELLETASKLAAQSGSELLNVREVLQKIRK